jgi:hypothetical protein
MSDPSSEELAIAVAERAERLAAAIDEALVPWADALVRERAASAHVVLDDDRLAAALASLRRCATDVRALLVRDLDDQPTTPLSVLRSGSTMLTTLLAEHGVAPVDRDAFDEDRFPADRYALGPFAWSDLGPEVHDAGIGWGAAKAFAHRARHRTANEP